MHQVSRGTVYINPERFKKKKISKNRKDITGCYVAPYFNLSCTLSSAEKWAYSSENPYCRPGLSSWTLHKGQLGRREMFVHVFAGPRLLSPQVCFRAMKA